MKALEEFQQQKPLVVDSLGQVIAGNGTLEAARRLKWTYIDIVRSTLSGDRAELYAIADNRLTDLSEFDYEKLATVMQDMDGKDLDLTLSGFQNYEIEPLMQATWSPGEEGAMPEGGDRGDGHALKLTQEQWDAVESYCTFMKANPEFKKLTNAEIVVDCLLKAPLPIRKVTKVPLAR